MPFLQIQSAPGLTVVQVPLDVPPLPPVLPVPGSQLPFLQTKFGPGFGVVQELVAGTNQGGSQLPLTQVQLAAGLAVVQVVVPPVGVGGATHLPFTQV